MGGETDKVVKKRPGYGKQAQNAYSEILKATLSGRLVPGSRITINSLQSEFKVGPTPIREALARLASEGFVVGEGNKGYSISDLSIEELQDITEQRKLVECQGLRQAVQDGSQDYFDEVDRIYRNLSELDMARARKEEGAFDQWEVVHRDFHRALISGANSPWLNRFQLLLFDHADRYRRKSVEGKPLAPEIIVDHRQIREAVMDRDGELAALFLARHIDRVFKRAEDTGTLF